MSDKMMKEYLEFFKRSIADLYEAQTEVYKELTKVRHNFMADDNIDGYIAMTGELSTNICKVSGRLEFLSEAFGRFVDDEIGDIDEFCRIKED